jgi:acetyl esterase/lipase
VAASVAYRFVPTHRFPSQVHDVKQAIRFLRKNAATYGIDPDRLGAMGFSAGGHLAMLLGTTGGENDDGLIEKADQWSEPIDQSSKVQAVVSYFGPTDFTQGNIPPAASHLVSDFLGGKFDDVPDAYRDASPALYVDSTDAPVLLFQGTRDPLVPYQQAVKMADAMTRSNVDGRIELLVNASHGWGGQRREHTNEETLQFFDLHLRKKH